MNVAVRVGRPDDAAVLREIEVRAGKQFRSVGLADIADNEPAAVETLIGYMNGGRCWVAVDGNDQPIGYLLIDEVDDNAHIEQVSVDPHHQRKGVGRTLIGQARTWAHDTGRIAVTLTTFREVPWNAPLYAHLDFSVLTDDEIGPRLRALRREEIARGLDQLSPRVCMRLAL